MPIPFIAYTSDAYVRSDFVEIAPQVSGVVNHVDVANDQKVAVGDLLATLDPEPFALSVDLDQKRLDGAAAAAKVRERGGPRSRERARDGEGGGHAGAAGL